MEYPRSSRLGLGMCVGASVGTANQEQLGDVGAHVWELGGPCWYRNTGIDPRYLGPLQHKDL